MSTIWQGYNNQRQVTPLRGAPALQVSGKKSAIPMNEMNLIPLESVDKTGLRAGAFIGDNIGRLTCYFGYRPPTIQRDLFCYALSLGFREARDESYDYFVKLVNGALLWTHRPDPQVSQYYYAPGYQLVLPCGTQCHFSIGSRDSQEDRELTEMAFGFVKSDLDVLVDAYCKAMNITGYRVGRITFSKTGVNNCDLTGALIPREFPYVTFAEPRHKWSHVTLYGFYCHLAFLLKEGRSSLMYEPLVDAGAKTEWLERVRKIATETTGTQIVLHDPH